MTEVVFAESVLQLKTFMIILVPDFAHEIERPHDQVFIAWMYHIATKHGFLHGYNLHPHDVRLICQRYFKDPLASFGQFGDHFLFGGLNTENWMFYWKREPLASPLEFKGERENLVWGYLVGREAEEDLVAGNFKWNRRTRGILSSRELNQFRYNVHEKD